MKVLIIDDNLTDRALIIGSLRREFQDAEFVEVCHRQALDEAMVRGNFDVVITDYRLSWTDGLQVVMTVQEQLPHTPIIMFTDTGGEEVAVQGMKAGLSDYVLKGQVFRLPIAVKESIEKTRLRKAHEEAVAALQRVNDELEVKVAERTRTLQELTEALLADIAVRQRAEEALKAALQEKEILLRETHHRVKNNLQVISSLLDLQAEASADPQVRAMFEDSQHRIRAMALIHETLYRGDGLAQINAADYLQPLSAQLAEAYRTLNNRVVLKCQVEEVWLSINKAVPCGLILNELLSNALKHAFPEAATGEILIVLRREAPGSCTLIVSDTGIGFPEGLDFRTTESLGLQLVCLLTEQIEGTISLERRGGTAISITFPV